MKKLFLSFVVLSSIVILNACDQKKPATWVNDKPSAQETESEPDAEEPAARDQEFNFNYQYPDDILMEQKMEFYPIGFSKDGLFAYLTRPCGGGCGCCSHNIKIQNIFTDKIVSELSLLDSQEPTENHRSDWKRKERSVISLLRAKGISQIPMDVIPDKEIEYKGHTFDVRVSKSETPDSDGYNVYPTIKYFVKVAMDQRGGGTLVTQGKIVNGISYKYIGYILSPYTDQVILLFESVAGDYENYPESTIIPIGVTFDPKLF